MNAVTGARSVTADDVVEVAGRIVDAHGADALTMRRLADELGVAVTSIYWHVGNRDELVAFSVNGPAPSTWSGIGAKVIVCTPRDTVNPLVTLRAAFQFVLPPCSATT